MPFTAAIDSNSCWVDLTEDWLKMDPWTILHSSAARITVTISDPAKFSRPLAILKSGFLFTATVTVRMQSSALVLW